MIESLRNLDQDITLGINSFHCAISDSIWIFFSDKKVWAPLYMLVLAFLIWRLGWKKALFVTIGIGLTILACDQTGNLVKNAVGRLRPCYNTGMLEGGLRMLEGRGHHFGFFSAHAADSFGLAICLLTSVRILDKDHGNEGYLSLTLIWAFMVSISRVFVGKHYFGDVAVGAIIGCIFGFLLARLIVYSTRRLCN